MLSLQKASLLVVLAVLFASTYGCKKNGNTAIPLIADTSRYDFTWSAEPIAGKTITFTSTAPEGSRLTWSFGTGITSVDAKPGFVYGQPGTYTVSLMVDGDSLRKKTKQIIVGAAFYINATGGPCVGEAFQMVMTDYPDAREYLWDFGDGHTSTAAQPTHIYSATGKYTISLTVNGNHKAFTYIAVYKDPLYTFNMQGMKIWGVQQRQKGSGIDETTQLPDVNFEVQPQDRVTVYYSFNSLSGTLNYNEAMSKDNVLAYGDDRNMLYYDHVADTIRIIRKDGPGKLEGPFEWITIAYTK